MDLSGLFSGVSSELRQRAATDTTDRSAIRDTTSKLEQMSLDIEKLLMITEALWTMLKEERGYSEEDLIKRIIEIDMRDGRLDGRVAKSPPTVCPKCGRPSQRHRQECLYCGSLIVRSPFER